MISLFWVLHFVLFNLLKNAIYYFNAKKDMKIYIRIYATKDANYLIFKDTGVGIEPPKIKQLFDNFTTSNKIEGTGLGLPFRRRITSFKGHITCQSKINQYIQFVMKFPITKDQKHKGDEKSLN